MNEDKNNNISYYFNKKISNKYFLLLGKIHYIWVKFSYGEFQVIKMNILKNNYKKCIANSCRGKLVVGITVFY